MDKDKVTQFQEILSSLHRDEDKISDIEKKQDYLQFCIEKLYDKIVDKLKDENDEEEIDSLDEEQLSNLILMEFIDNEKQWFEELQEIIVPDDIAEFVEEDQFEELKKQLEEDTDESTDEEPEEESEEQPEEEPEDNDESEPDSILEETEECVEPLQEDLLVDMGGGFQGDQQKKIKQMVLNEDDLYDIQEMIIEIGENLKDELDRAIEEREEEEEEKDKDKEDEEEDKEDEMGREPDGTGPHGRGEGPGKGKADGSGLKKNKDKDEEEDEEEDKEEITEQDNNLRNDIALHIALLIKQGNSPDYALDDARDVFSGQEIDDIIKQYDIQRVWADSKSLEELQQMSDEFENTNE